MKSLDSKTSVSDFFGKRLFIALIAVLLSAILGLTSVAVVTVRAEDNNDTLITYDSPDSKVWSKIEILDESRENVVMDVLANNRNKPYLEQGKTYYLRAMVKKPKNATRFHFLVGDTKDKGITATYNGVKVVSPPGGATNTDLWNPIHLITFTKEKILMIQNTGITKQVLHLSIKEL